MSLRFDELYEEWNKYASCYCVDNEWLKKPLFIVLQSQLQKCTFLQNGRGVTTRENFFSIQQTGTGKGQSMSAIHEMFRYLNERNKTRQAQKGEAISDDYMSVFSQAEFTPQALVGGMMTRREGKKEVHYFKKGMLATHRLIVWGEGRNVLMPQSIWGDTMSTLLGALDESGIIVPTSRKDLDDFGKMPEYRTNASLITGTNDYIGVDINMLSSGILQRFMFSFRHFNKKECRDLRRRIILNRRKVQQGDVSFFQKEFVDSFYSKPYSCKLEISSDKDNEDYAELKDKQAEEIDKEFGESTKKYQAMEGFLNRSIIHETKIATIIASLENEKYINYEHLKRAFELNTETIESARAIILGEYEPTKRPATMTRYRIIEGILKKFVTMSQTRLVDELTRERAKGNWDIGKGKTREFLDDCVRDGIIKCSENQEHNKKSYFV